MSGETINVWGTQKSLEAAGGAIASGSVVKATTSYDTVADGLNYPDAEFFLSGTFSVAPTEGTVLALYARPLALDGASANAEIPEANRPTMFVGSFIVNDVTTLQNMVLQARDLPKKADYYIHNSGTGQSFGAGWALKVTPKSYKAAP